MRLDLSRHPAGLAGPVVLMAVLLAFALVQPGATAQTWPATLARKLLPVLGLVLFVALLWRGASVIAAAPALSLVMAVVIDPEAPLAAFESHFAADAGRFVARFFLVFLLGAIFGRALVESGCAAGLARAVWRGGRRETAPLAVAGLCAAMTLGGVGVFVIAFAVFPIAREIYARAGLPSNTAPAAIALGAFTATMTAIPGAPSLTNIVASTLLGTDAFAAPAPGLIAAAVMTLFGGWWLARTAARLSEDHTDAPTTLDSAPPSGLAAAPLIVTVVANAVLSDRFAAAESGDVFGGWGDAYWTVACALALGIATAAVIGGRSAASRGIESGAAVAVGPLLATAAGVGFGASVSATPVTEALLDTLREAVESGTPAFAAAVTALYAAVVGSSSGGLLLSLELHGAEFLAPGLISPSMAHRFASLGAGVLDTLPHSGAVLALLTICRATHVESYRDIFVVTVIGPAVALAAALTCFG